VPPDSAAFAKEQAEAEAATAAARREVAEAEREAATEAAQAVAEEEARQKAECVTWGIGTFQCPKKYCDPKETMHNMDALFDGKVSWEDRNPNPSTLTRTLSLTRTRTRTRTLTLALALALP
jgi:hypothetical protein